ncbi:hypothetical protein [Hoeflea sp.]|uniref:hypothetical protein n=1 Tax=Hoeflea sp. TaxID=1940281 RepID=UPI003747F565
MITLSFTLAACAGRPKPLEPQYPIEVTSVRVTAASSADVGFAATLQTRLEETLGRATRDVGRASTLRVIVRDRRDTVGALAVFSGTLRDAEVELVLSDNESGLNVRTRIVRASTASRSDALADSLLIAQLTGDIRNILGLSGYPPHPVSGAKRDLVYPEFRDDLPGDNRFTEDELRSDPLLDGSVTPATVDIEPETEAAPALDISKPLLSTTPVAEDDNIEASVPVAPPAVEPVASPENGVEASAEQEISVSETPVSMEGDEPCVVTVENDCSDPDSR